MLENELTSEIERQLETLVVAGWQAEIVHDHGEWRLRVDHPLSMTRTQSLGTTIEDAYVGAKKFLEHREFDVIARRPDREQSIELLQAVRIGIIARQLGAAEVQAVCDVLWHCELVDEYERNWLIDANGPWTVPKARSPSSPQWTITMHSCDPGQEVTVEDAQAALDDLRDHLREGVPGGAYLHRLALTNGRGEYTVRMESRDVSQPGVAGPRH